MTIEKARKIVYVYGGALADTPKGDIVRYLSKLPCEKSEIKKAYRLFAEYFVKYQDPSEEELENLIVAYSALTTFIDDDQAREINKISKQISRKTIDLNKPEYAHEKKIFQGITKYMPSVDLMVELRNLIEKYKKESEGKTKAQKQDEYVKKILVELQAQNDQPLTVAERKELENKKRADRRGAIIIYSIIAIIVGWYIYSWYMDKFYRYDFTVYACPVDRNTSTCYSLKADISLASTDEPSTVSKIYFNNGGYIYFDDWCDEISRNKKWTCTASNDEDNSEWDIGLSTKTRVHK